MLSQAYFTSAGIFFVASPMIDKLRVTALFSVSSIRNCSMSMSSVMTDRIYKHSSKIC